MSVFSALYTGVSGLNAQSARTQVIGNNIANISTHGFKASRVCFEDILSQSLSGASSSSQIGRGTSLAAVTRDFSQGSLETTNAATDMAVDGDGFFIVNNGSGDFYTRAGQFSFDANGNLVNPQGMVLQGDVYVSGSPSGIRSDLSFNTTASAPSTTSEFSIGANLDSRASGATSFSTSLTVFDALGTALTLTLTFTKSSSTPPAGTSAEWSLVPTISDTSATVQVNGASSATVSFNTSGALNSPATDPTITITGLSTGATIGSGGDITFDLIGNSSGNVLTGYASTSAVNAVSQNGYSTGSLLNISISQSGLVSGLFTNGQSQNLAQIVLSKFTNPWGLTSVGDNLYAESYASGQPIRANPEQSGLGSITANSLELSNVDLSREFVNLIQTQRAFQANSKIIMVGDELLADLVNIVR
ncbi:MAG TPA: flagellar hook protein FlgE [Nitrospinota bacterium]|nr:flagellar hook protein FlgE [Nitrospinota bacterium]